MTTGIIITLTAFVCAVAILAIVGDFVVLHKTVKKRRAAMKQLEDIKLNPRGASMDEYQTAAARTINPELDLDDMLFHGVFGLCSEAGEVAGLFQKVYQGHLLTDEALIKELGDCLWMIAEICTAKGIPMSAVALTNIEKLKARYKNGFTVEESKHRKAGDI